MAQYLLNIYQPEGVAPPPDALEKVMRDVGAFIEETKAKGVWVFNAGLHPPSTSTVVRVTGGDALITDGPFVESKEFIGGFVVVAVADLDAALEWAKKLARVLTLEGQQNGLAIEVRPFQGAGHP